MSALPFIVMSAGMTVVPMRDCANFMSGKNPSISRCAAIFVLSVTSFRYPSAVSLICSAISALTPVILILFKLPSTPARICTGSAGKSFLKSSGIPVKKRNKSFLPISAIILAEMLPSLFIWLCRFVNCEMFHSAPACTEKYESVVFSSSPDIPILSSLAIIFPPADIISSPERSFILSSFISAFISFPQ